MKPTTQQLVTKIVNASEELDRVELILQAIDALRPRDACLLDTTNIMAGLAVEAFEIIHKAQTALFAANEGEAA